MIPPTLQRARRQDSRLKLHTEPHTDSLPVSEAFLNLKAWVAAIVEPDKYRTFEALLRFPIGTTEVSDSVFNKAEKIFESDGFFYSADFNNPELEQDATEYRSEHDAEFWRTVGFSTFKSAPNSFIVVDLPEKQVTGRPSPYYHIAHVDHVVDVLVKPDETCEFIIYKDVTRKLTIAIDDDAYRVFIEKDGEYELINEQFHSLGYCPARSFWSDRITPKDWQKKNIITPSLGALDWLFVMQEGQKHLESYGLWPIFSAFEQKCTYEDPETGGQCVSGVIVTYQEDPNGREVAKKRNCPNCTNRKLNNPGTSIEAPAPTTKDDPNLLEGVKWIEAPIQTLENVEKKIGAKTDQIIYSSIGKTEEPTKEAVNELQVMAGFEDRETILNNITENFEKVHRWGLSTSYDLRYGDSFLGLTLNYGRKHMLKTVDELKDSYEKARPNTPFYELSQMRANISSTQYKNKPDQLTRVDILSELEPMQDYSIDESFTLYDKGLVNINDFVLKSNFTTFIKRFERENMDLVSYMSAVPLDVKIELIRQELNEYVSEIAATLDRETDRGNPSEEIERGGEENNPQPTPLT